MGKIILAGKGFAHFDRQDARYFQDWQWNVGWKMKNDTLTKFCRELQLLPGGIQINILSRIELNVVWDAGLKKRFLNP